MSMFYCEHCHKKFEAEGEKTEWVDRTYGPCSRWTATCLECGSESGLARAVHAHGDGDGDMDDGCESGSCGCGGGGSCSCGGAGCSSCGGC
jgi:hypothetical protein